LADSAAADEASDPSPEHDATDVDPRPAGRYGLIALVAAIVLLADQLTKAWAISALSVPGKVINVVASLDFRLAFNSGMAFSQGQGLGRFIGLIVVAVVAAVLWFARTVRDWPTRLAIGMIVGGALGNLADRAFRAGVPGQPRSFMGGSVVDFIYTGWWPTFNIADASVVCGGILLAVMVMRAPPDPS
jgi:signal peptidase II